MENTMTRSKWVLTAQSNDTLETRKKLIFFPPYAHWVDSSNSTGRGNVAHKEIYWTWCVLQVHVIIQKWRQGSSQRDNQKSLILNRLSGLVEWGSIVPELWQRVVSETVLVCSPECHSALSLSTSVSMGLEVWGAMSDYLVLQWHSSYSFYMHGSWALSLFHWSQPFALVIPV